MKYLPTIRQALALGLICISMGASAQEKPPIKLLVGFAPGASAGNTAMILSEGLRQELKRTVIVEFKPGANGRLAAELMKNAPADGNTYLVQPDSWAVVTNQMATPAELRYNYHEDFVAVARLNSFPWGIYVNTSVIDAKTVPELIAKLKANPQLATYGSTSAGGYSEFLGTAVSKALGVKLTHIAHKGGAEAKTNLLGGHFGMTLGSPVTEFVFQKHDKVIPLGFLTKTRWALAPHVPTMAEQGVNVTEGNAWMGVWTSAKAPKAEVQAVEAAIQKTWARADVRDKITKMSLTPDFVGSIDQTRMIAREMETWKALIKESGYKP